MAKLDPQVLAHLEWLGFVRPTGLVVSAPALVRAGAILDQRDLEGQRVLRARLGASVVPADAVHERAPTPYGVADDEPDHRITDFRAFATSVLGWRFSPRGYAGTAESPIPPDLEVSLSDAGETLRPDYAVRELEPQDGALPWQLLVCVLPPDEGFDHESGRLDLTPHSRMERLLRHTGVPAGLLVGGRALRLMSAPYGESSGWLDFRVADMAQTAGRPICTAMRLLLSEQRLLALPHHQRLAALLADSRKFQNEVSEKLAEQVLHALYELLRGFQAAHDASKGELLRQALAEHPDDVYRALLTVILRLVFLLYAEERDMLPEDETFLRYYSLAGLHERLREDAALYPDTMDQRYGAWAQLVALCRMIHDGAQAPGMSLPPRHGVLFDPDRFPFLEGRKAGGTRQMHERIEPPLVPDGTVYRALEKLLVLDGERISYRALDVEQIGSVYETMMGFRLESASGRSLAIRSQKKHGAPTAVDLDALLAATGPSRAKAIQERADRKLTDTVKSAVTAAATLEDLHAALLPVVEQAATPDLVPKGGMVLQPSEERRRSGSHYTPRELTQPIVRTTLDPILARLRAAEGKPPRPEPILDLKVCDPAMGSGAFLVEACRYLGDALVESWRAHGERPEIPPDEDEVIFARRLVAQRCLYGVDRNPVAVDLAKMSLWLVTLAKDHALTFVDHALRHGDSLVGLSRRQLEAFHWKADAPRFQAGFEATHAREHLAKVAELRRKIREAKESVSDWALRDLWNEAQFELEKVRLLGDLAVAAFFEADKPKDREAKRLEFASAMATGGAERYRGWVEERRGADPPLAPFHWEIEFPEVFERQNAGFDALVGNPPFLGGKKISGSLGPKYLAYLNTLYAGASGQTDLVAYFFRRCGELVTRGSVGLLATKTISKGDTRKSGLRVLCSAGWEIVFADRRIPWPGTAAVTVSSLTMTKGLSVSARILDQRPVDRITAFLLHLGGSEDPRSLACNQGIAFGGYKLDGLGFTFDDLQPAAEPLDTMKALLRKDVRNADRVFPLLGGDEILTDPQHRHRRFVIDFGDMSEAEARKWPDLLAIVEERVRPERAQNPRERRNKLWWQFGEVSPGLRRALVGRRRIMVHPYTSTYLCFALIESGVRVAAPHVVICLDDFSSFAVLQSRVHEVWAEMTSGAREDRLVYLVSDCFRTFPPPHGWTTHLALEPSGRAYYEFRAALMVRNDEGLTTTYNRFHDRDERDSEILRLRELHGAMDKAVLDAYGWSDVRTDCSFFLDYEIDEGDWGDKKKPYRYRWPDETRDEVLARLLELNAKRAAEEVRSGAAAGEKKGGRKRTKKPGPTAPGTGGLFT